MRRGEGSGGLRLLGLAAMGLGLALLGLSAAYFVTVAIAESRLAALEARAWLPPPAAPEEPASSPLPSAEVRLVIPAIQVDSPVVHVGQEMVDGVLTWERPKFAVGHLAGTAQPGEQGNAVMAGHILTLGEGSVFRRLPEIPSLLEQGLPVGIWVYTPQGTYLYWAQETLVVEPEDTWVVEPTSEPTLTLITCVPSWNPTHRLVVIARRDRVDFPIPRG